MTSARVNPNRRLEDQGITGLAHVHYNLLEPALVQAAIKRGEGHLGLGGAFLVSTGSHTGRSPKDKFVVRTPEVEDTIWWENNTPMAPDAFDRLEQDMLAHLEGRELFVQDLYGGADPEHRLDVRVATELAWHGLFIRHLLRRPEADELASFDPEFTIINCPSFKADPARHGCRTETVIALNLTRKLILIANTAYAGENKKSVFTLLNYLLPGKGIMPMHCSANHALDDPDAEPEIYATTSRFASVVENMVFDPDTLELDFCDDSLTANMRVAYPLEAVSNASPTSLGGVPKNIIMLTCDAFGVLPPIARLTPAQAMYHFLSGFTSKVAGTEQGVTEPQPTFSTCFGAPFMPRRPEVYGKLLQEKIARTGAECWLVNTGWTGGAYGAGSRMPIKATRALLSAALDGSLTSVEFRRDPNFGFDVPVSVAGVPDVLLDPRRTWADTSAYDAQAAKLVTMFAENFAQYAPYIDDEVKQAAIG